MKTRIILFSLLFATILTSCQKNEFETDKECNELLFFNTEAEFLNTLKKVSKMSDSERLAWEKSSGFKSLGLEAEKLYAKIKPGQFKTIDEVNQFVNTNQSFFELNKDENGEFELDTKFGSRPERYLMNLDQMYQIGDSIYKFYSTGILIGSIDKKEVMIDIMDVDKLTAINSEFRYISKGILKSGVPDCGTSHIWRSDNSNERLKVVIEVNNNGNSSVTCSFVSRPYVRIWPVWYQCSRKMKASVELDYRYIDVISEEYGSRTWGGVSDKLTWSHDWATTDVYFEDNTSSGIWILSGGEDDPRFTRYKVWADTDKVSPIDISCNI